ncbi:MAG: DUF459 domain-containing protein, partial [Acidimicrobiales bacterium]
MLTANRPAPELTEVTQPLLAPTTARPRQPAGRVLATVFVTLLVSSLLCADSLHRLAGRQAFGVRRDVSLAVTGGLRSVSHAFGLHLPRVWLARLSGNEDPPMAAAPPAGTSTPSRDRISTSPGPDGGDHDETAGVPLTVFPTTTTLPPRRTPTAEAPLRLLLAGDSLMGNISEGFGRLVRDDPRLSYVADAQVSTGLARPDVLDWPSYLAQQITANGPEVVVLIFGANDDQPLVTADGGVASLGSDEWRAEYGRRVAQIMDVGADAGRTVVWLGMPSVARERLDAAKDVMNDVARIEADKRPSVSFVDTVAVFGGPGYRETLALPDGNEIRLRIRDGVHLTADACDVLAPV